MQIPPNISLVAAADLWEVVIGIIFFVLYGLGQLMSGRNEAQKKAPPRPQRPPRPPQQPGQPNVGGAPPNQADPLRAEVEEFLRRAQGKPAEQRRPAPPPQQMPPRREVPGRERPSRPGKPATPPQRKPMRTPEPEYVEVRVEGVAEHVARHVTADVQSIAEQSSKLGAQVAQADERMEAHLEGAFQHQVGRLEHREQEAAKLRPQTMAEEIRELIRQPDGARKFIIANEVLRRPEERW